MVQLIPRILRSFVLASPARLHSQANVAMLGTAPQAAITASRSTSRAYGPSSASSSSCVPRSTMRPWSSSEDQVGVADRREPVGDDDRRAADREAVEGLLHEALGLHVERARGLVQHEHRRVAEERARDREPLLLAARRSGSRARRRPCRSRRGARRGGRGCARRARPPRAARRSRRAARSAGSRARVPWKRYVSCETTPTVRRSVAKLRSRTSWPSKRTAPPLTS